MSQHTAGPWTPHATSVAKEGKDYDYTIASVSSILPNDEARANARLIAAATTAPHECNDPTCLGAINKRKLDAFPELLINLQTLTDRLMRSFSSGYASAEDWRLINEASAAIVKATE